MGRHHPYMNAESRLMYTVKEAAELLSLSRAHLYRLIDSGEIGSVTVGRCRRITHHQIEEYLSGLELRAGQELVRLRASVGHAPLRLRPLEHEQTSR